MVSEARRAYNAAFTPEVYQAVLAGMAAEVGFVPGFRVAETPLFLSAELTRELERAAWDICDQVTAPSYLEQAADAVPPGLAVPHEDAHTTFLQVDFALARDEDGRIVPRLIELQGFPSLYGFQWLLDRELRRHAVIPEGWTPYFGVDADGYAALLRETIVGDCDPEQVVLLEVEPAEQKTRVDFVVTERLTGVKTVDVAEVVARDGRLLYRSGAREVPIRRIYNRVIFDEVLRKGVDVSHLFRDDLDVQWIGHPNWFSKISKFSLPFLTGPYAPEARFLDGFDELPEDLENWVLKPLYSFAGLGVELGPSRERLEAIERPRDFILQRKVDYAPVVETLDVPAKAEVRMMFLRTDRLRLVNNLVRLSKGAMMGVDFNKRKTWVGGSLAYHPPMAPLR